MTKIIVARMLYDMEVGHFIGLFSSFEKAMRDPDVLEFVREDREWEQTSSGDWLMDFGFGAELTLEAWPVD